LKVVTCQTHCKIGRGTIPISRTGKVSKGRNTLLSRHFKSRELMGSQKDVIQIIPIIGIVGNFMRASLPSRHVSSRDVIVICF
jgi:hypothetical protein